MSNKSDDGARVAGAGAAVNGTAGIAAASAGDGRNFGVLGLIFGVGGLLMSWMLVGGVLGVFGIVLGVIAMAKAIGAKRRAEAVGEPATISGSFGLGIVALVTGAAAVVVSLMLYQSAEDAISKCENLDKTSSEYSRCISNEMGTDQPKQG